MRFKTISVIGLGYIGLPTATVLASRGVEVIGVDISERAVTAINQGQAHFFETDLDAMVRSAVQDGRLRAVPTPEPAEAFIIAVPTPLAADRAPDLTHVEAAGAAIAPVLKRGDLVILESTSPVGTVERLAAQMAALRPDLRFPHEAGEEADILMAYCPERIIPGRMMTELVENDRIVGGLSAASTEAASALYGIFVSGKIVPTGARAAEMIKLTENAYRDVNIAFANELSMICDALGVNVWEVIELANHHPRVNILQPGPGVGGHCIAIDPWFIVHAAGDAAPLIRAAREVNDRKPHFVVEQILARAGAAGTICCLGLAYKANVDDLRESPAIEIVQRLLAGSGADILVCEPNIDALPASLRDPRVKLVSVEQAVAEAEAIALLVDHREFVAIDREAVADRIAFDSCGLWEPRGAAG